MKDALRQCLANWNPVYRDVVKNLSEHMHREEGASAIQRGPSIEKAVYVLSLTLIGLAAETLRIKQTDLDTGLSGLS